MPTYHLLNTSFEAPEQDFLVIVRDSAFAVLSAGHSLYTMVIQGFPDVKPWIDERVITAHYDEIREQITDKSLGELYQDQQTRFHELYEVNEDAVAYLLRFFGMTSSQRKKLFRKLRGPEINGPSWILDSDYRACRRHAAAIFSKMWDADQIINLQIKDLIEDQGLTYTDLILEYSPIRSPRQDYESALETVQYHSERYGSDAATVIRNLLSDLDIDEGNHS